MQLVHNIAALRDVLAESRDKTIALVPTMGNLHQGHMALVKRARELAGFVVVSVFVNPTQFGVNEDFSRYPRTLEQDCVQLADESVDLVFAPETDALYPASASYSAKVSVAGLDSILCGASRPGHFAGVATIVCKLFNLVQPDIALFGEKDYQQLLVIRALTESLNFPIQIEAVATVRETDGLALSSRNQYLDAAQRKQSLVLIQSLREIAARLRNGERDFVGLEQQAVAAIGDSGVVCDYIAIRSATLQKPPTTARELRILGAIRVGNTRLIDNIAVCDLNA